MFEIAIGVIVGAVIVVLFVVDRAIDNLPAPHWLSKKLKGKESGLYGGDCGGSSGGPDIGRCD